MSSESNIFFYLFCCLISQKFVFNMENSLYKHMRYVSLCSFLVKWQKQWRFLGKVDHWEYMWCPFFHPWVEGKIFSVLLKKYINERISVVLILKYLLFIKRKTKIGLWHCLPLPQYLLVQVLYKTTTASFRLEKTSKIIESNLCLISTLSTRPGH